MKSQAQHDITGTDPAPIPTTERMRDLAKLLSLINDEGWEIEYFKYLSDQVDCALRGVICVPGI